MDSVLLKRRAVHIVWVTFYLVGIGVVAYSSTLSWQDGHRFAAGLGVFIVTLGVGGAIGEFKRWHRQRQRHSAIHPVNGESTSP